MLLHEWRKQRRLEIQILPTKILLSLKKLSSSHLGINQTNSNNINQLV